MDMAQMPMNHARIDRITQILRPAARVRALAISKRSLTAGLNCHWSWVWGCWPSPIEPVGIKGKAILEEIKITSIPSTQANLKRIHVRELGIKGKILEWVHEQ
jgi:hypothetical protein